MGCRFSIMGSPCHETYALSFVQINYVAYSRLQFTDREVVCSPINKTIPAYKIRVLVAWQDLDSLLRLIA